MQTSMERLLLKLKKQKTFLVRVKPNKDSRKIVFENKTIYVHLTSSPSKNQANMELEKYLSELLNKEVYIKSGLTSKKKIIKKKES